MAISRMAEEIRSRGVADVFKWWLFMATDIIGGLSFGETFRMLELGEVIYSTSRTRLILTLTAKNSIFFGSGVALKPATNSNNILHPSQPWKISTFARFYAQCSDREANVHVCKPTY